MIEVTNRREMRNASGWGWLKSGLPAFMLSIIAMMILSGCCSNPPEQVDITETDADIETDADNRPPPGFSPANDYFLKANPFLNSCYCVDLDIAPDGSIYSMGIYEDTIQFGQYELEYTEEEADTEHRFICKFDAAGSVVWVKEIDNRLHDRDFDISRIDYLKACNDNSVVVMGYIFPEEPFEDADNYNVSSCPSLVFLIKYNEMGDVLWDRVLGGYAYTLPYGDLDVGSDGSIYILGLSEDGNAWVEGETILERENSSSRPFIWKFDADGNLVWKEIMTYTNYGTMLTSIRVKDNLILLTGEFTNTLDFDPGPGVSEITSSGGDDALLLILNTHGVFQCVYGFGYKEGDDIFYECCSDNNGNYYACGESYIPNNDLEIVQAGWITKFNNTGVVEWNKYIGAGVGGRILRIKYLNDSTILVFGRSHNQFQFIEGNEVTTSLRDIFIARFDENGQWLGALNWPLPQYRMGYTDVILGHNGNIYCQGYCRDNAVFQEIEFTEGVQLVEEIYGLVLNIQLDQ